VRQSTVKRKLKAGQQVLVPKVCYLDPNLVEMLGLLGFDCVWICSEYKAICPTTMENMIRASRAAGMDCVIRTGSNGIDDYARFLSMGANGLMIPHVPNPIQAREVIAHAKYPPLGNRELENVNVDADFGLMPLQEYLATANEETFIVVQIEDVQSVDRVEEIAGVEGIDVLFVGPADLSLSMGIPGQTRHAKVLEAIRRVAKACEANGIACGAPAINPEHCELLLHEGVRYLTGGSDWRILLRGFREMRHQYGQLGFTFREERLRS